MWKVIYHGIFDRARQWGVAIPGRKAVQITVETDSVLIIRRRSARAWCRGCAGYVDWVGIDEAKAFFRTAQPMLQDCAKAEHWHYSQTEDGSQLVCLESLLRSI